MESRNGVVYRSERLTIAEMSGAAPQAETSPHALVDATLVFVRCGLFGACNDRASIVFDANDVLFGCDGDDLYPVLSSNELYACTVFCFADAPGTRSSALPERCVLSSPEVYLKQARISNDVALRRTGDVIEDAAFALLRETGTSARGVRSSNHEHLYTVQAIKERIHRSLAKPPRLAEVAQELYLSPFTVSRMFHKETGISLRRYVHRLRLRRALYMMLNESAPLTEIAIGLGFYDESHFSNAFSAEFGCAPGLVVRTTTSSNTPPNQLSAAPLNQD